MSGNPLFIPETRGGAAGAARAFYTFGKYNTICFAPFGIDGNEGSEAATEADLLQIKEAYGALDALTPLIIETQSSNKINGLMVTQINRVDSVIFGEYKIKGTMGRMYGGAALAGFDFLGTAPAPATNPATTPAGTPAPAATATAPPARRAPTQVGGALIICTAPGEFIISGRNMSISVTDADPKSASGVSYLSLEEGTLDGTTWIPTRRLNGDEFRVSLAADKNKIYKMTMYKY
jgi:hypothetical protein